MLSIGGRQTKLYQKLTFLFKNDKITDPIQMANKVHEYFAT